MIEKVGIGFVDTTGATGKLPLGWRVIEWFQNSPIVHCFMVYKIDGVPWVYETTETTFQRRPLTERVAGTPVHLFDLEITTTQADMAHTAADALMGSIYDYSGIAGLGLMLLTERVMNWLSWPVRKLFKLDDARLVWINNPWHMQAAYFCSESVIKQLSSARYPLPEWWTNGEFITPRQLFVYFNTHLEEVKHETF